MKNTIIFIACMCILFTSLSWTQAEADSEGKNSKKVAALKKQIKLLEIRIKYLEGQIESLENKLRAVPNVYPKLKKIPKGWKEYEYEGQKYYLVPLAEETQKKLK